MVKNTESKSPNTKRMRDAFWNTLGSGALASISFILLTVVTRIYGVEEAATIGICITTSQLLYRLGLFTVGQFQVTDTQEKYTFSDYCGAKFISSAICIPTLGGYLLFDRSITGNVAKLVLLFLIYQLLSIDDLYQNKLFQKGRLDLSGRSKCIVVSGFLISFVLLAIVKIPVEGALLASFLTCLILSYFFCTRKSEGKLNRESFSKGWQILLICLPMFISNLLFTLINSIPRYTAFYLCTREESGYFNVFFVLLNVVELIGTFIYYPFIGDITKSIRIDRRKVKKKIFMIGMGIVGVALVSGLGIFLFGIKVLSYVYALDFSAYRFEITYTVGVCGAVVAITSLLCWIPVILRDQKSLIVIFLLGFIVSTPSSILGGIFQGVRGIIIGYSVGVGMIAIALAVYFLANVNEKNGYSND